MKHFIFFVSFLAISFFSYSQRFTTFSDDPGATIEEMKSLFSTASPDRKKESDAILIQFEEFWNSPWIDSEQQEIFIDVSNTMLRKKMRPYPHFKSYIEAYTAFITSPVVEYPEEWKAMLSYHVEHDMNTFQSKMENYTFFFTENVIFKTGNARWRVEGLAERMGVAEEPFIEFKDIDLIGASRQDSLTIAHASGFFLSSSNRWNGTGGEIYWDRAGMGNQVKASLSNYEIDLRTPKVTCQHALLHYPERFSEPIPGALEEKAFLETTEEKATYPRFKSTDDRISILSIYENVDYIGGFEMRGSSIMGSSSDDQLAHLIIKKDNRVILSAWSANYLFKVDGVLSEEVKVSIYIEEDSIYHPAANLKYTESTNELLISRPRNGIGRTPFFDSYHKMDITAEAISWKTNDERIEIKPIIGQSHESAAVFESQNYFDPSVMRKIQGYNEVTPLYTLWELFRSYDYQKINFQRVVSHFKKSDSDVRQLLIEFAAQGFIEYDIHKDEIHYRSKMAQYLNNDIEKRDYDHIRLESKSHYASIDLLTNEMRVSGCEFFVISDAQIVNVYPTDERVTVKKNRDMVFSGRVVGGLFDFIAHNCIFDYERFKIEMNVIDSLVMYVEDKTGRPNMYGEYPLRKVKNSIEEVSGTLYVDVPGNKSGKVDYPDYPMFESRKGGKVFYDHQEVLGGVYHRDQFYYAVNEFKIVNLDNFAVDSMRFTGYLMSGGIFPDIHEPLVTRPDFSLGFIYRTDEKGLPAYEGKGHFYNTIDLSNNGLRGAGTINYLTSVTTSDSLVFYLDKVDGNAKSHTVKEQLASTEFPEASVKEAFVSWEPYQDLMLIHTRKEPMTIFRETNLTGFSKLTPTGMFGGGVINFKRADLTAKNFEFKHHELLSDAADLRIHDPNTDHFAFTTDNYQSHVDFQTRKGAFVSNGDASEVVFIKNEFKTNASHFEWDPIDENLLRFKWEDPYKETDINNTPSRELVDMTSEGNELISTSPSKKSLAFSALNAEFDFGNNIIKTDGVRFIPVGDAAIIPFDGKVTIYEKAEIASFTQSRILAGIGNKHHELYNANIKINSRTDFKGSGEYDYIDENKEVQTIHFDSVWFFQNTKGQAKIPKEKEFKFNPHFSFDGRVELHSERPFLYYVGGVEMIHDCDTRKYARLRILQEVDPENVMIEIHNKSRDVADRKAVVAIASTNREGRIYTAFGSAKDQFNDAEYIAVTGFIMYDKASQSFRAASLEKLNDPDMPGNIITLDKYNCVSTGSGAIDMGTKLGRIDFNTNGSIVNYTRADSAVMHLTTSIDFFFNDESMKIMNNDLEKATGLNFVDVSNDPAYDLALLNILGDQEYQKYQKEMALGGQVRRLPQKLQVKFLFSNIDFIWDKENSAFVSQSVLPLIINGAKQVYKMVPGQIVIEKRGSRNRLYLYFEFDGKFFFFQFENNSMYGFSSEKEFNDAITKTKAKNRALAPSDGQPSFSYRLGNRSQQKKFVNKYYLKIEEE